MAAYCLAKDDELAAKPALIVIPDAARATQPEVWTYASLEEAVLRLAGALRESGLAPGDRVLIRLESTSTYAILFFACIAAGLVALPTSAELTASEVQLLLSDSGAAAIALSDRLSLPAVPAGVRLIEAGEIERMMRRSPRLAYWRTGADDPAFLVYTSGTTALPKGVLHAHRSALGRRPMVRGWYGLTAADRMLHAGAFNWTFTLGTGLTDPWANGATSIVYTGEKDPTVWPHLIASSEATLFAGVPGVLRQILKYARPRPGDLGSLRHALIAGETPPPGLFEDWEERTGRPMYEALGMSEISTYISSAPSVPRRPGAVGKPQPGRRVAILPASGGTDPLPAGAEGLLAVHLSDPGLMLGYWRRPEEEREVMRGEWFIGGDLARMDGDGYVTHLGRANEVMKVLGYRVSPLEVEAALADCPGIAEVACAEVEVAAGVSLIGAFVVPGPGATLDVEAVKVFAAGRLASYKCPREIIVVANLPRTANGKIRRSALAALAGARNFRH
jgi:acyl-coenzyme A synthetase/AMP-(fatty) acid ligase